MPVLLDHNHPAYDTISEAYPHLIASYSAQTLNLPYRHIGILNIMPTKIDTEVQLIKKLGVSPIYIEITWIRPEQHICTHTDPKHLNQFYKTIPQVLNKHFDGMIITGAPVELLDFTDVDYWFELMDFLDWCEHSVPSTLHLCWAAQARLYQKYGIHKYELPKKLFGVFSHKNIFPHSPLMSGFDPIFKAPHSRYTNISYEALANESSLNILAVSDIAGVYLIETRDHKQVYVTGHPEYEIDTLPKEYFRDVSLNRKIDKPYNVDLSETYIRHVNSDWNSHATLLYMNWLHLYAVTKPKSQCLIKVIYG